MKQIIVQGVPIEIERKSIKNMYLKVLPPEGRVHITAPLRMKEEEIKRFVISKLDWIEKQQGKLEKRNVNVALEYKSRDILPIFGTDFILELEYSDRRSRIEVVDNKIILMVKETSTVAQREKVLNTFYASILEQRIPALLTKWERVIGVKSISWYLRNMKTRWGTCNVRDKKICFNLQLGKKSPECLEYVVVHELVHLLERSHNSVFKAYMDQFLPEWRSIRKKLNGID